MYYCALCKKPHRETSDIGMKHSGYASKPGECRWCADFRQTGKYVCLNCGRIFPENKGGPQSSN